jgi:hypothetical protein
MVPFAAAETQGAQYLQDCLHTQVLLLPFQTQSGLDRHAKQPSSLKIEQGSIVVVGDVLLLLGTGGVSVGVTILQVVAPQMPLALQGPVPHQESSWS